MIDAVADGGRQPHLSCGHQGGEPAERPGPALPHPPQALNAYADQLSKGLRPEPATLTFHVRQEGGAGGGGAVLLPVAVDLPPHGSFGPLFHAFGLISGEELASGAWAGPGGSDGADGRNLADWLRECVGDAVRAAEAHDGLKRLIRETRAELETRFGLAAVAVGGEYAVSAAEQQRQVDALRTLGTCLAALAADDPARFEGLSIR